MTLGGGILSWVKEIKYLGIFSKLKTGLRMNVELNCKQFLGTSLQCYRDEETCQILCYVK